MCVCVCVCVMHGEIGAVWGSAAKLRSGVVHLMAGDREGKSLIREVLEILSLSCYVLNLMYEFSQGHFWEFDSFTALILQEYE